jgi:hypothetical protein
MKGNNKTRPSQKARRKGFPERKRLLVDGGT